MKVTRHTLVILFAMVLVSVLLANFLSLMSTNAINIHRRTKNPPKMTDTDHHLIWFLQISDIHISIFNDPFRISEFKEFCDYTIDAIKPRVVMASGDLTDAKTREGIGSRQFKEEWVYYSNILKECQITKKTVWLDIRGNHDNFNVAGPNSEQNFFTNYSIQGKNNPRSYMYQVQHGKSGEIYSFIGVDACLEPGPRRPFNFIGLLDQPEVDEISRLIRKTITTGSNYTIWYGHFPTSCILSTGKADARDLIGQDRNGLAYLCGHLHQLGGLVPKMYTLQKNGFLELELSDWKDNRMYRLMAIDHGMLSFIDVKHRQWPVVLITNPKHGLFVNLAREKWETMFTSTHIRILAFSLSPIKIVKIRIDNSDWFEARQVTNNPLYVAEWDPKQYLNQLHYIEVYAQDDDGRVKQYRQPFQLSETRYLHFDILPRMVLMTNASTIFQIMFLVMLSISTLPIGVLRLLHNLVERGKMPKPKLHKSCCKLWLRKLWILSTIDRIFWPLIMYPVYLCFGPWSIGYLIEEHLGVIFAWGIFINGAFLPGSFTYAYGFIQLVTFQLPLTMILAHGVDIRFQHKVLTPDKRKSNCAHLALHLPFLLIFCIQVSMAYLFWLAYGTMAFFLGPLRTWSVVLAAILWYQALYLPEHCIKRATDIWHRKIDTQISQNSQDVMKQQ